MDSRIPRCIGESGLQPKPADILDPTILGQEIAGLTMNSVRPCDRSVLVREGIRIYDPAGTRRRERRELDVSIPAEQGLGVIKEGMKTQEVTHGLVLVIWM